MFQVCKNTPEFIKDLATRIVNGEYVNICCGIGCGKTNFMLNLGSEIIKQMEKLSNEYK